MSNVAVHIGSVNNPAWNDGCDCTYTISVGTDIWRINIPQHLVSINKLWLLLTTDEQTRANGYYRENDRQRFVIARGYLRLLVEKYLKIPAAQITFEFGGNGKPRITNETKTPFYYNVSHSCNYVLIAFADAEVGVDVEFIKRDMDYAEVMHICFNRHETQAVSNADEPLSCFYTLWTRKESLLKATAKGIDDDVKLIPSLDGEHCAPTDKLSTDQDWIVNSFEVDEYHMGCITAANSLYSFWNLTEI